MSYLFENYELDEENFCLTRLGQKVPLEPKSLRVLLLLVAHSGKVVEKATFLSTVWKDTFVEETTLTRAIVLLRKQLGDHSRRPRFIETVPTIGFRFIAAVTISESYPEPYPEPVIEPVEPDPVPAPQVQAAPSLSKRNPLVPAMLLLILVAALGIFGWLLRRQLQTSRPIRSVAVLPLENLTGDPGREYFVDGMTDELITELAHIPNLRVVSRTSVMQEKGVHKPLRQIAQELNVDAIVEGSIVGSVDRIRITAQLIDARTDKHLWAQSFEGRPDDVVGFQDSVASEVASQTQVTLNPPVRVGDRNVNPEAHDAYLRGRYFFERRDIVKSTAYYREAVAIDPQYASAYAGLADALESNSALAVMKPEDAMPAAIAAARRAIELDPHNGEAYSALGGIETSYERNWNEAERNLERGIQFDPNDSLAEMRYAVYLDAMDRPEEAVTHMRRAVLLDPLSFFMNRHLGSTLYLARRYDEALKYLRRAEEMEPNRPNLVRNWMSWIHEQQGLQDEAVEDDLASLGRPLGDEDAARLRRIYQTRGWKAYWQARIEEMRPRRDSCTPYFIGAAYLRVGEADAAFAALNDAVDEHCLWISLLQVDPLVDPARLDWRFAALLGRANLTHS